MTVWRLLRTLAVLWLLKRAFWLLRALVVAVVLAGLWPVTGTAAAAAFAAWLRGWPPARLYRAAAWSVPMTIVYLLATALGARTWHAVTLAPVRDWQQASRLLLHGHIVRAVLVTAPVGVPAGLAAGPHLHSLAPRPARLAAPPDPLLHRMAARRVGHRRLLLGRRVRRHRS